MGDFARHIGFRSARLDAAGCHFDGMHQYAAESAEAIHFERCEGLSQLLNRACRLYCAFRAAIAQNASRATEIGDQFGVRLMPFPLLELKAESERLAFEKLNGIH